MRWSHYSLDLQKKSGGETYDDLETPPLKQNQVLETDHISVENETTAYTNVRFGIKDPSSFIPIEEQKYPSAAERYWTDSNLRFVEHQRVCVRLTGCTSGDVLKARIQGKLYELPEP